MPDVFNTKSPTDRDQRFRDDATPSPDIEVPFIEPPADGSQEHVFIDKNEDPMNPIVSVRDQEHTHLHLFSSYAEYPKHVTFHNQEADEDIILFLRGTLIRTLHWIIPGIFFFIVPPIFFSIFPFATTPLAHLPLSIVIILLFTYYHSIISYIFVKFLKWYFNICLITSKRIVDIDFVDLVYKNVAETKLALVQDVSYTQSNVVSTLFNYGDILIQTAGTIENFELHSVPQPERVVEILENLIGKGREEYGV